MTSQDALRILADPNAFWEAIYPHITEAGPDLNFADVEEICRWLRTSLDVDDPYLEPDGSTSWSN